jgi:hypothetical protein
LNLGEVRQLAGIAINIANRVIARVRTGGDNVSTALNGIMHNQAQLEDARVAALLAAEDLREAIERTQVLLHGSSHNNVGQAIMMWRQQLEALEAFVAMLSVQIEKLNEVISALKSRQSSTLDTAVGQISGGVETLSAYIKSI